MNDEKCYIPCDVKPNESVIIQNDVKLENEKILCLGCGRKYSIRNGVPIMLIDESEGGYDA